MGKLPAQLAIEVPNDLVTGTFANAFRIVEEAGSDIFLDFLAYSAKENRARVVSRVRIRRAFIDPIRDSLTEAQVSFRDNLAVGDEVVQ